MLSASISSTLASPVAQAIAFLIIHVTANSLCLADSSLLSLMAGTLVISAKGFFEPLLLEEKITAAAQTGPASAPMPTSSMPAIFSIPCSWYWISCSKEGMVAIRSY